MAKNIKDLVKRSQDFFMKNVLAIFLLWAFWLTFEYLAFGQFSYIRIHDVWDSYIPMKLTLSQDFIKYGVHYWYPYSLTGIDGKLFVLNMFQLDSVLYFIFPGWSAYGFSLVIQRFIAGYFTYRLCKDFLKLDEMPSVVAGLAYAISFSPLLFGKAFHSTIVRQFAGEMGFPFLLWSLEYISKKKETSKYLLVFSLGLFTLFSSNLPGSLVFILPMILVWFILVRQNYSLSFLKVYSIFAVVTLVGNIPQILALIMQSPLSHRAYWPDFNPLGGGSFVGYLINDLLKSFVFFKNTIVYWGFGVIGLIWIRGKDRSFLMIMFLLAVCGIGIYLIDPFISMIKPYIGLFSGFNFTKLHNLAPFFATISLGFGLHHLMRGWMFFPPKSTIKPTKLQVQTVLCTLFIIFLVFHSFQIKVDNGVNWGGRGNYAANFENPDLKYLAEVTKDSDPFRVATVAYASFPPAFANAYGFESVDGYITLYPKRYHDFWGKVIEPLTLQDENIYENFHYWGSQAYLFAPYEVFSEFETIPFSEYYNLNLLSLANTKYIISRIPITHDNLTLLPSEIPRQEKNWGQLSTIEQIKRGFKNNIYGRSLYIYENENVFPRFFLVDDVKMFPDSTQLLDSMGEASITELRNIVYIEEQFASNIETDTLGFNNEKITIMEYSPDSIVLEVDIDGSGILTITNSYSPYWKCQVDGIEKEIIPIYNTFSGIYVESDQKVVTLNYHPPYLKSY